MKSLKLTLLLLVFFTALVACAEQKILERVSLVTLIGYDLGEEDQLTATSIIRQINPELESKVETHSETGITSKGIRVKTDLRTSKRIVSGQLRVVLIGEELAKKGLNEALHTLTMNSEISSSIYLAIVEGDAKPLIEYKYENIKDIGQYIFQLIDHNVQQHHAVSSTLHETDRDNLSPLHDFALPMVKREGEVIKISSVAFFKEGKMVGDLPADDAFYIMMIRDNLKTGTLQLALHGSPLKSAENNQDILQVAIDSIQTKQTQNLVDKTVPEFDLTIDMECRLLEIDSSVKTGDPKSLEELEKEISKELESQLSRIINYSQEINSDIFGFGEHYKIEVRNTTIDAEKWHEMYPNMKVNVTVNTKILRSGVFE